ncbi:MAG: 50S ribosomal protein L25 [Clostridiales bacterium]|nr:50S ribosomal protein L25 [Clostridiales bacterium]
MNTITAKPRDSSAKVKQLRRSGIIPCVIYGGSLTESLLIQIDQATATKLLRDKREGSKVRIDVGGKVYNSLIKDIARNPVSSELDHIGFQALQSDKKANSKAQVILLNKETVPGILEQLLFEIPYAAYPEDMIDTVTIDLTGLGIDSLMTVEEIEDFKGKDIDLQVDADALVFKISDRRRPAAASAEAETEAEAES